MRIHAGVFTHECSTCDRRFTRREHFQRHNCQRKSIKSSLGPLLNSTYPPAATSSPTRMSPPARRDLKPTPAVYSSSDNVSSHGDSGASTASTSGASGGGGGGDKNAAGVSRRKKTAPKRFVEEMAYSDEDDDVTIAEVKVGGENATSQSPRCSSDAATTSFEPACFTTDESSSFVVRPGALKPSPASMQNYNSLVHLYQNQLNNMFATCLPNPGFTGSLAKPSPPPALLPPSQSPSQIVGPSAAPTDLSTAVTKIKAEDLSKSSLMQANNLIHQSL